MTSLRRLSLAEQVATLIAQSIETGRWGGELPGVNRLAEEVDASPKTVRAALRLLETQGLLNGSGPGRRRSIATGKAPVASRRVVRVAVLLNDPMVEENAVMQRTLFQLHAQIVAAGHACFFADKCQSALGRNVQRIVRFVQGTAADVWLVLGAPLELLTWFAAQPFPSLALGGRGMGVSIASASATFAPAVRAAVGSLADLGHRRIVMLCPRSWRSPVPGDIIEAYNAEMAAHGITPGEYHAPNWEETPEGLEIMLNALFQVTPPSALLVVEPAHAVAVIAFLGRRSLEVGRDLSLVCMSDDPAFAWRRPPLAHFAWDNDSLIRCVVRWVGATARGRADRKQWEYPATFVPGGTIMAPPRRG